MKYVFLYVRERTDVAGAIGNYCGIVSQRGDSRRALVDATFSLIHLATGEIIMHQIKRVSTLFLAIVFTSILGCAGSATQESTGEYVTDTWITTKVKAALVDDPQVKATEVNVETFKGVVQLSGFVSSYAAVDEAVRVTRRIKGVTSVKNDMRVK